MNRKTISEAKPYMQFVIRCGNEDCDNEEGIVTSAFKIEHGYPRLLEFALPNDWGIQRGEPTRRIPHPQLGKSAAGGKIIFGTPDVTLCPVCWAEVKESQENQ